jgi:hypothetical protein
MTVTVALYDIGGTTRLRDGYPQRKLGSSKWVCSIRWARYNPTFPAAWQDPATPGIIVSYIFKARVVVVLGWLGSIWFNYAVWCNVARNESARSPFGKAFRPPSRSPIVLIHIRYFSLTFLKYQMLPVSIGFKSLLRMSKLRAGRRYTMILICTSLSAQKHFLSTCPQKQWG